MTYSKIYEWKNEFIEIKELTYSEELLLKAFSEFIQIRMMEE